MKSSEMSPLIETIEISEDVMRCGVTGTNKTSDLSNTPSEWRNGKYTYTKLI